MLSHEEATEFIAKTLDVVGPIPQQPGPAKLTFINAIVKNYHLKIPFHNISHLADDRRRDVPSLCLIKEDVLEKRGGLCYTNNVFMLHLLRALGYTVEALSGTCNPVHSDNHVAVRLKHMVHQDDVYLVDVACGSPTFEAVSLDFHHESPIFTWGYLICKFIKKSDRIDRLHAKLNGEYLLPKCMSAETEIDWTLYYHLDIMPRNIEYFYPPMHEVYANRFRKKITAIRFVGDAMLVLKTVKDQEGSHHVTHIRLDPSGITRRAIDQNDLAKHLQDLLPAFEHVVIARAVENWENNIA